MKRLFRELTACVLAAVMLFVLLPVSFSILKAGAEWAPDREWEWTRSRIEKGSQRLLEFLRTGKTHLGIHGGRFADDLPHAIILRKDF